jgi:hypothetical protein
LPRIHYPKIDNINPYNLNSPGQMAARAGFAACIIPFGTAMTLPGGRRENITRRPLYSGSPANVLRGSV